MVVLVEILQLGEPIPHATELLDALEASPDFNTSKPIGDIITRIKCIEDADPNNSELSIDDSNENWGHQQFSGLMNALQDWTSVGNVETACRILAATIKTCKAARYICSERNITPSGYLVDAYLRNLVERIWQLWTAANKVAWSHSARVPHFLTCLTLGNPRQGTTREEQEIQGCRHTHY